MSGSGTSYIKLRTIEDVHIRPDEYKDTDIGECSSLIILG